MYIPSSAAKAEGVLFFHHKEVIAPMPITEFLERNARLYGSEVSLVEINPSEARDKAATWREQRGLEM